MMYEEFTSNLEKLHVPEKEWPDVDLYHDIIEFVYNYHPVFDVPFCKAKIAEMYARYGLGIFYAMREAAHKAKTMEENMRKLQIEKDKIQHEYDKACESYTEYRHYMMQMWRCE